MLIRGLHNIFVVPAVLLVLLAIGTGIWRLSTRGPKRVLISVVRIVVYGGFALFVLFCALLVFHYSTGGH
jgi:hypothetical protein